jgi:hypothetical protein
MWVCESCGPQAIEKLENQNKPSRVIAFLSKAKDVIVDTAQTASDAVSYVVSTAILNTSDTPQDPLIQDKEHKLENQPEDRIYSKDKTVLQQGRDYIKSTATGVSDAVSNILPGQTKQTDKRDLLMNEKEYNESPKVVPLRDPVETRNEMEKPKPTFLEKGREYVNTVSNYLPGNVQKNLEDESNKERDLLMGNYRDQVKEDTHVDLRGEKEKTTLEKGRDYVVDKANNLSNYVSEKTATKPSSDSVDALREVADNLLEKDQRIMGENTSAKPTPWVTTTTTQTTSQTYPVDPLSRDRHTDV